MFVFTQQRAAQEDVSELARPNAEVSQQKRVINHERIVNNKKQNQELEP